MFRPVTLLTLGFGISLASCGPAQPDPEVAKPAPTAAAVASAPMCPPGQVESGGSCIPDNKPACPGATAPDGSCMPEGQCPEGTHPGAPGQPCVPDAQPAPTASAPPAQGPCPAGMALVKGGSYKMAFLKREATVADVCMDIHVATAKEYEACVDKKKCNTNLVIGCPETSTYKVAGREDHPMVCIDFTQATDYCSAQGKRLPTEEEWEWAARGGEKANQYSWGNDEPGDIACWSGVTPRKGTCPVTAHPKTATPDGIMGMSGNVFEWVTRPVDVKIKGRAGRGGSWRDGLANVLRVDRPGSFEVTYRCGFLGVRCVAPPAATPAK
ncbi:MAG: SUMF1/EgtB/PvdO family nonheme iron enzyme [Polyangiaceae bacterium]